MSSAAFKLKRSDRIKGADMLEYSRLCSGSENVLTMSLPSLPVSHQTLTAATTTEVKLTFSSFTEHLLQ